MARRLKAIAAEINEKYPALIATIEEGYCNTDRKIRGTRLRHPGKGRTGNRLIVRWRHLSRFDREAVVLDHNAAEAYRTNQEVEDWLRRDAPRLKQPERAR